MPLCGGGRFFDWQICQNERQKMTFRLLTTLGDRSNDGIWNAILTNPWTFVKRFGDY
jgi:hypothetical protein